jgi:dTDP-4-amino-4,6-dideoxygalactose transaminase
MKVPFLDLVREYKNLKPQIDKAIGSVLKSGKFILGENVSTLESKIARASKCRYAVGVASGTDALKVALAALDIKAGDEIITSAFTYIATTEAIIKSQAKPVFADINPLSYTLDPKAIEKAITKKTKAIIPVHLYGQPADMSAINEIAKKHKLAVIEDAAQAYGSVYGGQPVGSLGDIGCFSFFPTKNLAAYGDGGMVTTNNKKLYELMLKLRVHGAESRYNHIIDGYNSRLDELQAAILNVKMRYIKIWIKARRESAKYYDQLLKKAHLAHIAPEKIKGSESSYCLYTLRVKDRDKLLTHLVACGVDAAVYYPIPLHLQKVYKSLGYKKGDLPSTETASDEVISIPIYPGITKKEQKYVINCIRKFYK